MLVAVLCRAVAVPLTACVLSTLLTAVSRLKLHLITCWERATYSAVQAASRTQGCGSLAHRLSAPLLPARGPASGADVGADHHVRNAAEAGEAEERCRMLVCARNGMLDGPSHSFYARVTLKRHDKVTTTMRPARTALSQDTPLGGLPPRISHR